jgi:diguanylate cyclase (GGDEF)-like protein/PAS domain S-box-containing protein
MDFGTVAKQFDQRNCVELEIALEPAAVPAPLASAEFLAAALRHARVGTWQVDMPGGWFTWDAVTSDILGLPSLGEAAGSMLPIHPGDRAAVWKRLKRHVIGGGTESSEFRIVRPTGEVRWVRATGRQREMLQAAGRYVAGIITDITEERVAAESLREAEERYRLISQVTSDLIFDWDIASDHLRWNEAKGGFFGYTSDELGSMSALRNKLHPDDRDRVVQEFADAFRGSEPTYMSDHRFRNADGSFSDVLACGSIIRGADGRPARILGSIQDVTERRYADAALRESEAINRGIVEASTDSVVLLDLEGKLLFLNNPGGMTTEAQDLSVHYGKHWTAVWPEHAWVKVNDAVKIATGGKRAQISEGFEYEGRIRWWEIAVSPIVDEAGKPIRLVAVARDVTEQREATEKLQRAAAYDTLTGLPNRARFQDRLAEAAARASATASRFGLLLLDVDDFKQVNDSMGHDAGDALLKSIASRLERPSIRPQAVARLGGDEFAVLLEGIEDSVELAAHAQAILAGMKEPLVHGGRVLDCHVTIGAALFPDHGPTQDDVLKSADIALYVAKATARGGLTTFEPVHRDGMRERANMVSLARSALHDGRIVPFYQPKLALDGRRIHGFEALLRWQHPTRGIQLPATIAAAFEDLDVSTALSRNMIDQVIGDMRCWLDEGIAFGHVAVNAAAAEFRSDNFAEGVLSRLHAAGVPTSHFQLEVTETVFLGKGAEYVDRALKLLDKEGVRIALDDFGTGYASLRHLKQFPVHVMKIDQGFVKAMGANAEDEAIISAVLNLGKSLNIDVVAEGIETTGQETRLRELGCEFGQGFLYSEAVAARFVPGLLDKFAAS